MPDSPDSTARTSPHVPASAPLPAGDPGLTVTIPNWRDIGGLPLAHGLRVRDGLFFRSSAPDRPSSADLDAVEALGIGPVFDLRTAGECASAPDVLPPSARPIRLDVLADKDLGAAPARMMEFLSSPKAVHDAVGAGQGAALMEQNYRDMVALPSAVASYREMVRTLLDDARPSLVHCTSGKDRTGWATAIVLFALGADEDAVRTDYLRTNELYLPTLSDVFARFTEAGGDADDLTMLLGVRPEYLHAAIDEAVRRHGSVDGYLRVLGLDDAARGALRAQLAETT